MKKEKIVNGLIFWLIAYPVGLIIGLGFCLLKLTGRVKVANACLLPVGRGRKIIASNHPSLWEPILLIGMFFGQYVFHPIKLIPWSTPDKGNYWNKWYWRFGRLRFIPVPRGNRRGELEAMKRMMRVLRNNNTIILFPEGGRTHWGQEFVRSEISGKEIRELKSGIGHLVFRTKCLVVPVWVEGTEKVLPNNGAWFPRFWRKCEIKIGVPLRWEKTFQLDKRQAVEKITDDIAQALIALADEKVDKGD